MSAVIIGQERFQSEAWHKLRTRGIGGSEVAAIVGLSPYESRFSLWHRKRGSIPGQDSSRGMSWGVILEPVIIEHFRKLHPELAVTAGATYAHEAREWQLANPDSLINTHAEFWVEDKDGNTVGPDAPSSLLEVKTASAFDAWEWAPAPERREPDGYDSLDSIPPHYACQILWYMDVLGVPDAWLAVLIGGSDYREYRIAYDAEQAVWLRGEAEAFWASVLADEVPAIDGSDATYQAVRKLNPELSGEDIELDPALWVRYDTSKTQFETAKTTHQQAKSEVLDAMGDARRALVNGTPVLRRQQGKGGISLYPIKTRAKDAA